MSEDEAQKTLLDNVEGKPKTESRTIRFKTGRRLQRWNKNCVAVGLASGFLEPLESTSIHLIQNSIIRLIELFPAAGIEPSEIDRFNREVKTEIEYIRDFIIAHYHVTQRADSPSNSRRTRISSIRTARYLPGEREGVVQQSDG